MTRTWIYSVLVLIVMAGLGLGLAQDAKPPATVTLSPEIKALITPTVSEVTQLQGALLVQRMANAELRIQAAQQEMQNIKTEWDRLIVALQKPGYTLNPATWTYTKVEPTPPPPVKK